jgi:hypothetical protein
MAGYKAYVIDQKWVINRFNEVLELKEQKEKASSSVLITRYEERYKLEHKTFINELLKKFPDSKTILDGEHFSIQLIGKEILIRES